VRVLTGFQRPHCGDTLLQFAGREGSGFDRGVVGLGRHHEVVAMEPPTNFVGPPHDRHPAPFRDQGGMVSLLLGERADLVGEGDRVGKIPEAEKPSPGGVLRRVRLTPSRRFERPIP